MKPVGRIVWTLGLGAFGLAFSITTTRAAGLARSWNDYYYGLIFPVAIAGETVMTLSWGPLRGADSRRDAPRFDAAPGRT